MKRSGSPTPPPMFVPRNEQEMWGDRDVTRTKEQNSAYRRANTWMQRRVQRGDIDTVRVKEIAGAILNMIAARSPTKPDFMNYMDELLRVLNSEMLTYQGTSVEKLSATEMADFMDWSDWRKRDKREFESLDDGFVVPDPKPKPGDEDYNPEEDEEEEDEFDSDFESDDFESDDFESEDEKPAKRRRGGGGIYRA